MTEVLKWVGIGAAVWVAAAVLLAVFWHRAKKAQPRHCTCDYGPDWPDGVGHHPYCHLYGGA